MANIFYNRVIRKLVVGFGSLFDNIVLVRYNSDNTENQRITVPIIFASREKYISRIMGDPDLTKKVQITLPRMSYEMTGIEYDSTRKLITNVKNYGLSNTGVTSQYNPVPYDFDFSLYVYVRSQEDGTQIVEHILPYFTPDYTISLNLIPELGITKDIPIILKGVEQRIEYEGERDSDTRLIIWTLNFKLKGYIYGPVTHPSLIKMAITSIYDDMSLGNNVLTLNVNPGGFGSFIPGEQVYQGNNRFLSTASATVVDFNSTTNKLQLEDFSGSFNIGSNINGVDSLASWNVSSYQITPLKMFQSIITPNPPNANANSQYTYTTTVSEFPNIV